MGSTKQLLNFRNFKIKKNFNKVILVTCVFSFLWWVISYGHSFVASVTFKITRSCRTAHCPFDCLVGVIGDYVQSVCSFPTTHTNETLSLLILKPTQA